MYVYVGSERTVMCLLDWSESSSTSKRSPPKRVYKRNPVKKSWVVNCLISKHRTINHRYDTMWKLWPISGFRQTFDVLCLRKLLLASSHWDVRKNVFNLTLSHHQNVKWKHAEVKTTSHCGLFIKNCERCQVEDAVFLQLPDPIKVSLRVRSTFLKIPILDWKHSSSRAQWPTFSSEEHQTLGKKLKSTQVFNLRHI